MIDDANVAEAVQARPADPPKDTAELLELLQETLLTSGRSVPETTRAALSSMKVGGQDARFGYVARGEARPAYKRAFAAQLAVFTGRGAAIGGS